MHVTDTLELFGPGLTLPFIGMDEFGGTRLIWLLAKMKGSFYIIDSKYSTTLRALE